MACWLVMSSGTPFTSPLFADGVEGAREYEP